MSKQYITKERLDEFRAELDELKNKRRNDVAQRLKQAKEYGDLSENSEYAEAREEQANVESRIFELEELLKNAVIIEKKRQWRRYGRSGFRSDDQKRRQDVCIYDRWQV